MKDHVTWAEKQRIKLGSEKDCIDYLLTLPVNTPYFNKVDFKRRLTAIAKELKHINQWENNSK